MLVEGTPWTKAWILKEQRKGQHICHRMYQGKVLENEVEEVARGQIMKEPLG